MLNWENVSGRQSFAPPALRGASLAYDSVDNYLLLFGGCSAFACPASAQTWKFAGGTWTNLTAGGAQPPARAFASMAYESKDGYVVLFGGLGVGGRALGDTWIYVGGIWTNITTNATHPAPEMGGSLAYDHIDADLVLFGGGPNSTAVSADTWTFSAGTWRNLTSTAGTPPAARSSAGFVWDDLDAYTFLFGGRGAGGLLLNDSWTFVRGKWTAATITSPTTPAPRSNMVLTYFSPDNAAYLVGGNGSAGPINDTWRYSGGRWTNETTLVGPGPPARVSAAAPESTLAWTSTGVKQRLGFLLDFGGGPAACGSCGGPSEDSTWVLEPVLLSAPAALPSVVEAGAPVLFSAIVTGGSSPYVLSWQFGDGTSVVATAPSHGYVRAGSYTVVETVQDQAGVTETATVLVTVTPGPAVVPSAEPAATDVGRIVWFNSTTSGGTSPYTVRWNFGDGTSALGTRVTHAYSLVGVYSGNVSSTDSANGVGVGTFTVRVDAQLGLIVATTPGPLHEGQNISFQASITGGTPPFTVAWSFGDNASGAGSLVQHVYAHRGTYTVQLAVQDGVGSAAFQNFSVVIINGTASSSTGLVLGLTPVDWVLVAAVVALGVALAVLFLRRRRRRSRADGPIAAAAAGAQPWEGPGDGQSRSDSRAARRNALRWGRR